MKCYVCQNRMEEFFRKDFKGLFGLNLVHYWKCIHCGFVLSKTHLDMDTTTWERLNNEVHSAYQGTDFIAEDPRWLSRLQSQAKTIRELADFGILPTDQPWLDFACGDGKLADMLSASSLHTLKYDRYMSRGNDDYVSQKSLSPGNYGNIITTSFLEHVLKIETLDEMASLISKTGVLSVHTLVRETISPDPDWFYLLPVHVAFHTNKSMQILFDLWGFHSSLYHLESRMWFWFRTRLEHNGNFQAFRKQANSEEYFYKNAFMDYWK